MPLGALVCGSRGRPADAGRLEGGLQQHPSAPQLGEPVASEVSGRQVPPSRTEAGSETRPPSGAGIGGPAPPGELLRKVGPKTGGKSDLRDDAHQKLPDNLCTLTPRGGDEDVERRALAAGELTISLGLRDGSNPTGLTIRKPTDEPHEVDLTQPALESLVSWASHTIRDPREVSRDFIDGRLTDPQEGFEFEPGHLAAERRGPQVQLAGKCLLTSTVPGDLVSYRNVSHAVEPIDSIVLAVGTHFELLLRPPDEWLRRRTVPGARVPAGSVLLRARLGSGLRRSGTRALQRVCGTVIPVQNTDVDRNGTVGIEDCPDAGREEE